MFEDIKKEPEDMFDATDKVAPQVIPPTDLPPAPPAAVSGAAQAPAPSMEERVASVSQKRGRFPWKGIILVVGVLVVMGAVFFLSMKILNSRTAVTPEPSEKAQAGGEGQQVEETPKQEENKAVTEEVVEPEATRKDTDKDGLTDDEENQFGTSIRAADTDADGLFDLEEIKTWETDPLDSDTDGDGYLDGEEVDAGYNPNGDGPLREAPTTSS